MAITYSIDSVTVDNSAVQTTITSGSLTLAVDDIITALVIDADNGGTFSIANSGSALSWTALPITNTASNAKVGGWWAKCPDTTARTVTVSGCLSTTTHRLHCIVHTGAHTTNPVPSGNAFSGVGGTDVSQVITPSATNSALWMVAGDWSATNSYVAITNCTLEGSFHDVGQMSSVVVRPTTQPRTDAAAFTIGETDTSGKIAWLAFEVRSADGVLSPGVVHDASVESHTGTTGSTSAASYTWNHTLSSDARGFLVFAYTNADVDNNLSVTLGGIDIPKVTGGQAIDTTTEPGRCTAFFRGTGLPTGLQAVVVTRTNNANTCYAVSVSVIASKDTTIPPGSIMLLQNNTALAEQSVNDASPGANSVRYAGIWSGLAGGAPTGAASTSLQQIILAAAANMTTVRETTAGQGARSVGFTSGTSDDAAAVHLAVSEIRFIPDVIMAPLIPVRGRR